MKREKGSIRRRPENRNEFLGGRTLRTPDGTVIFVYRRRTNRRPKRKHTNIDVNITRNSATKGPAVIKLIYSF